MKKMSNRAAAAGPLRQVLDKACEAGAYSMKELTVMRSKSDPYRRDTPQNHTLGAWFAQQVERFVPVDKQIHIRGAHYLISSSGKRRDQTPTLTIDGLCFPHEWRIVKIATQ